MSWCASFTTKALLVRTSAVAFTPSEKGDDAVDDGAPKNRIKQRRQELGEHATTSIGLASEAMPLRPRPRMGLGLGRAYSRNAAIRSQSLTRCRHLLRCACGSAGQPQPHTRKQEGSCQEAGRLAIKGKTAAHQAPGDPGSQQSEHPYSNRAHRLDSLSPWLMHKGPRC